jgi:prophage tail gpP-like protein
MTSLGAPVMIFVAGQLLRSWTSLNLVRKKKDLTGEATIQIFRGYIPDRPIMKAATAGAEILIYIGGHLAFTGGVDKRKGKGKGKKGGGTTTRKDVSRAGHSSSQASGSSVKIDAEHYQLTLHCRGKTRKLVDSSHKHDKGTILGTNSRAAIEAITAPFGVELRWRATARDMDKVRYRDGGIVADEVHRIGNAYATYLWESRDGALIASDERSAEQGEPLVLGDNILEWIAEQGEDQTNTEYEVKGGRTEKTKWGKAATKRKVKIKRQSADTSSAHHVPTRLTIQYDGDAKDEDLERRAKFEADNRESDAKPVSVEVFHVVPRTGQPWDLGTMHYVEIPPEDVFEEMECTEIHVHVDHDKKITTTLKLTPPPSGGVSGGATGIVSGLLSGSMGLSPAAARARARRAELGISYVAGEYPAPWGAAALSIVSEAADILASVALVREVIASPRKAVSLLLPPVGSYSFLKE